MIKRAASLVLICMLMIACENYRKDDYTDNSPTSGKLKVVCDEGLAAHIKNQALTFESQYKRAKLQVAVANDDEAVKMLYHDSCEAIVISRLLNKNEEELFAAIQYYPRYSLVAYSGVAVITNSATPLRTLEPEELGLLLQGKSLRGSEQEAMQVLIDKNNSSVMRYLLDSIVRNGNFGPNCRSLGSSAQTVRYIAENPNVLGIVDFAWLSDRDDPTYKEVATAVLFVAVKGRDGTAIEPNQSSFKLQTYPYTRPVYVMRKKGEFTIAKGFESFVAGPKGQLTFLKQGLLPARQAERQVEVKFETLQTD